MLQNVGSISLRYISAKCILYFCRQFLWGFLRSSWYSLSVDDFFLFILPKINISFQDIDREGISKTQV